MEFFAALGQSCKAGMLFSERRYAGDLPVRWSCPDIWDGTLVSIKTASSASFIPNIVAHVI